jgi:hypothetical protein
MEEVNKYWDFEYKVNNFGFGSPEAPHWRSKVQKVPKLAKSASKVAMPGYDLL